MAKRFETLAEATQAWVAEFSRFPTDMIETLMAACDPDDWMEVTPPAVGDRVYLYAAESDMDDGEIIDYDDENGQYKIKDDEGFEFWTTTDEFDVDRYDITPMWGSMWQFKDMLDDDWLEEGDGIRALADCGFRIYHHAEWGYFFGIDGAGYDFYSAHWEPLYKKRGLKWHEREE